MPLKIISNRNISHTIIGFFVILCLVVLTSLFGALFTPGSWYGELHKSELTPPGWVFAPVWLTLYLMIAFAGWLTWRKVNSTTHPAIIVWLVQLALNALWSWFFFGLKNPLLALIDIALLFVLILFFIRYAFPVSRCAGLLFLPYAVWVGFAAYLNLLIVLLN